MSKVIPNSISSLDGLTLILFSILNQLITGRFLTKAPTAKPVADICSTSKSSYILESLPYLTSLEVITEEKKTLKLQWHIVLDNKIGINSKRTTIYRCTCIMWTIAFLTLRDCWSYDIINTHIYSLFSVSISIFCVLTSNCICTMYIRLSRRLCYLWFVKKIESIPSFLRVLGILKSDVWFGTGTSLACDFFFKLGVLPKTVHHSYHKIFPSAMP